MSETAVSESRPVPEPTARDRDTARQLHRIARARVGRGRTLARRLASDTLRRARHVRAALRFTRRYARRVASVTGVSTRTQLIQQVWLALRHGFPPESYYRFKVYRAASLRDVVFYVPVPTQIALRRTLYERLGLQADDLADKRRFYHICLEQGLPVPPTVCDASDGRVTWWSPDGGARLPPCDLFSKQADSMCGAGAARWVWQGDGTYRAEDGTVLSAPSLIARLEQISRTHPIVLQQRLTNHAAVLPLAHRALCTARIVTYRRANGAMAFLFAFLRMPTTDVAADNYAMGGLASQIDEASGRLGPGSLKAIEHSETYHDTHPVSGARIEGFLLPDWQEALALCFRAHRIFGDHFSVGWDVALTSDGPDLIEGNYNWDVVLAQQPHGKPLLSHRDFAESYLHWLTAPPPGRP